MVARLIWSLKEIIWSGCLEGSFVLFHTTRLRKQRDNALCYIVSWWFIVSHNEATNTKRQRFVSLCALVAWWFNNHQLEMSGTAQFLFSQLYNLLYNY